MKPEDTLNLRFSCRFFTGVTLVVALLISSHCKLFAQEKPPRPFTVTITVANGMMFGAFFQTTSSGTVVLTATGSRTFAGGVFQGPSGFTFSPAIYQIDANKGQLISLMNGPDATLTGSNGGTITLRIGASDLGSPFVCTATSPATTPLRVGGTLTIGPNAANPPGNYSGTYTITFVQN